MTSTVFTKTYTPPPINIGEVLRYAGVKGDASELEGILLSCIEKAEPVLSYRVCYGEYPVSFDGDFVKTDFMSIKSQALQKNLIGCDSIIIFGATIGISFDRLLTTYSSLSPTKAVLLQAIGAERIESLCDMFCKELSEQKAKEERRIKPRFSPGYGDLPLSVQRTLFDVLDCPRKIGLTLNESLIMSPSKSVTAIVGVTKAREEQE